MLFFFHSVFHFREVIITIIIVLVSSVKSRKNGILLIIGQISSSETSRGYDE